MARIKKIMVKMPLSIYQTISYLIAHTSQEASERRMRLRREQMGQLLKKCLK